MRKFNLTLRPEEDNGGLLAVIESEDKLTYINISTIAVERVKWNNYTPTIPCGDSALPTYIQLLGCFNEVVDLELMKEYVLKAVGTRRDVNLDLVHVGKSDGIFRMLYQIPGYQCFYSPEYCYVKTPDNEMYTLDNDSVPRGEIWDFLTLNAIVYILSKGENNLCYNDELKTPDGFSFKKNMTNTGCNLMYWDRYTNEAGETKFVRELKDKDVVQQNNCGLNALLNAGNAGNVKLGY